MRSTNIYEEEKIVVMVSVASLLHTLSGIEHVAIKSELSIPLGVV